MPSPLSAFHRSCWSKSRHNAKVLCSVCYCYRSSSLFATDYCCSPSTKHSTRQICDTCLHQHILSKLYSCLTTSILCPEVNCRAHLPPGVICHMLLKFDSHALLDDYLREQQWQGKSEEWINRFALRCPGCESPIEKNGGCDEMLCIRCQTHFYWSKARRQGNAMAKPNPSSLLSFSGTKLVLLLAAFLLVILFYWW